MIGIIQLLVILAIIGLVAWALTQLVPMPQPVKTIIYVVAVLACLLVVLQAFGGFLAVPDLRTTG